MTGLDKQGGLTGKRTMVYMDLETVQMLRRFASENGQSGSRIVCEAVKSYIRQEQVKIDLVEVLKEAYHRVANRG